MGDIAEMMLDGTLCECCGIYLDDDETGIKGYEPSGYPVKCINCKDEN